MLKNEKQKTKQKTTNKQTKNENEWEYVSFKKK